MARPVTGTRIVVQTLVDFLESGDGIVHTPINKVEFYRPLFPDLVAAIERVQAGEAIHAGVPPIKPDSALA